MRSATRLALGILCVALAGCSDDQRVKVDEPTLLSPGPGPWDVVHQLVLAYEQKKAAEYQGCFTGDFTYEFSNATDPTLVQQLSTGWFKNDEKESSAHLFGGYTPPGEPTLPAAATIEIHLAVSIPTDDNSSGVDPATHKIWPRAWMA